MKKHLLFFFTLFSLQVFGQINCGPINLFFDITNCPRVNILVCVCEERSEEPVKWQVTYPGALDIFTFTSQAPCPPAGCCAEGTINFPEDFDCKKIEKDKFIIIHPILGGNCIYTYKDPPFCDVVVPLDVLSFKVSQEGIFNKIEWVTSNEVNVKEIILESATDGKNFEEIARLQSQAENPKLERSYSYAHLFTSATNYYRLKIVDHDMTFKHSKVIQIENDTHQELNVFPNPAVDNIHINAYTGKESLNVKIYDSKGMLRLKHIGNSLDISTLEQGIYFLQINVGGQVKTSKFIVK